MAATSVPVPSAGGAYLPQQGIAFLQLAPTPYRLLPVPGAGTYPIALVSDSSATSGTVSAGGSTHVNVIVWTGTLWTVLKNVT